MPHAEHSDLLIIGGGFAGLSLAIALCVRPADAAPLKITIVESKQHAGLMRKDEMRDKNERASAVYKSVHEHCERVFNKADRFSRKSEPRHDPRSIVLNAGSRDFLDAVGVWGRLADQAWPIKKVHVSEQGRFAKLRFDADEHKVPALGYVVAGQTLSDALTQTIKDRSHVTVLQPAAVTSLDHAARTAVIKTAHGARQYRYGLLIAADGAHSAMRKRLDIDTTINETRQTAWMTRVAIQDAPAHTAFQRFTRDGTIGLLPLSAEHYKLVISGEARCIETWQNLHASDLPSKLQRVCADLAGRFIQAEPPVTFPITSGYGERQMLPGAVLLGQAAYSFSPVAAQGLNTVLQDIRALAAVIGSAHARNEDFAALSVLQRYADRRLPAQRAMRGTMRLLTGNLQRHDPLSVAARQATLLACDLCPPLHRRVAARFIGHVHCYSCMSSSDQASDIARS